MHSKLLKSPWRLGAIIISAAAILLALSYVSQTASPDAPTEALERKCTQRKTERICRNVPLYRTTVYDGGSCVWVTGRCEFFVPDAGW
ncbi:hypothetical protein [Phenylobacterium sp.]|uniref:hypothetical protein n=1 Tax=Phenylobacterium sp. TaxID=1871053 RepID=UPI00286EA31B|nr:hypothetical protein [Phenylobacterium sp.]